MSLFSESLLDAANTTAIQGGDLSFGQKAGGTVAGALVSGLGSIYNTGVAAANALGASAEEIDTFTQLESLDSNWAEYYKQNASAIDIAGFIGTSLLPGGLAVKGLNAVRSGEAVGAFGRALNYARTQQAAALNAGLKELAVEGGSVFTKINKNKMATMGWEFADQALQAATFELAVALTMKQSPLLADDSWWEIGKGIAIGTALGGAIGGGVGALGLNRGFKDAVTAVDLKANQYKAISGVEKLNLPQGDKAFAIVDSVTRLPEAVSAADSTIDFSAMFKSVAGGKDMFKHDISRVLTAEMKASTKAAMEDFELSIRKLAGGPGAASGSFQDVAEPMAQFIMGRYKELKQKGATPSQIRDSIGDVLLNLKKIDAATAEPLYRADELFYFKKSITPEELAKIKTIDDLREAQVRSTPFGKEKQAYQEPYVFLGSPEEFAAQKIAQIGTPEFSTLKAAWDAGYTMARTQDNALRINDGSYLWRRVKDPIYDPRRYLNTRTGAIADNAVLTAADTVVAGKKLKISGDVVEIAQKEGAVKRLKMMDRWQPQRDLEYLTARHAWASSLDEANLPGVIDSRDISLMERLKSVSPDVRETDFAIRHPDGSLANAIHVDKILLNTKIDGIRAAFAGGEKDIRALAAEFVTSESWIERVISEEFGAASKSLDDLAEGSSRDIAQFMERENLLATFTRPQQFTAIDLPAGADKKALIMEQAKNGGGQFVTGELAYAYRVQNAIKANQNAAGAVLGTEKIARLIPLDQDAAKLATSLGSGATFLGSSNANYGEILKLASQDIGKHTHQWIQEAIDNVVSKMGVVNHQILNNKAAAAELGIVTSILRNDPGKFVRLEGQTLILRELSQLVDDPVKLASKEAELVAAGRRTRIEVKEKEAFEFLSQHEAINTLRVEKETTLANARGTTSNKIPGVFYAPPIDTNYFQHFAFVRGIEGKSFGSSETAMIFGRDAAELQKRMALVDRSQFEVITKDGSERYFKAKGDYDFDQTINERSIDSELRRSGALANFFPETRGENIVEDFLRFHQNQESKLVRNAVESHYSQQIEELHALGRNYTEDATSKFSGTLRRAKSEITNPYGDFVKTMLDVSKRSEYRFFHQANEFVDALGTRAYQVLTDVTKDAKAGLVSWQEANDTAARHGIRGMYSGEADYFASNVPRDRNLIKEGVAKANTLLANLVLRFDFAQSIMNVVSTPLLLSTELASIRTLAARDSELTGALNQLMRVKVPGQDASIPSTMRLLHNAIKNFHGAEKDSLIKRYTENGDIKTTLGLYHSAISDLALSPNFQVFSDGVTRAADKVATLTGNNWAEQFTRFVSADVMRQVTEPLVQKGALTLQAQNAYISTFVNRVQGNYISSQRPVVFQGVLGGAIGLFQTYSFNLLQQLLRHVENKDKRAIATMFGMQGGLFGLNGTPMFDAINTHIIGTAAINDGHYDAYSLAPQLVGKEYGDWLMYGTTSAFPAFSDKAPALYSRGDINPRHMTILPMSLGDIPAIDASVRVVSNLVDVGKKLIGGADVSETLLQGLEHNGVNRPLAGFAQALAGGSTTSKGSLISANSDMELVTNASRILGAKPMDEAIALNNMYRVQAYRMADADRLAALGEVVKTKLMRNQVPSDEEMFQLQKDYASIGGRLENFNASIQRWSKDANVSVLEKMRSKMQDPTSQRLNEIMGGVPLEDSRNTPPSD